jgi:hypothetical protein
MFTADQVWGLAVAADRINEGYFKEPIWGPSDSGEDRVVKDANKLLVKHWLRTSNFTAATAEDMAKGQEIRNYFNGFLLKQISGKINEFSGRILDRGRNLDPGAHGLPVERMHGGEQILLKLLAKPGLRRW